MNFVFVSPHFPRTYWLFCDRLKRKGVNVLGIGDCPYDALEEHVKAALTEYYYVSNMQDYDQMLRAVGFFTFKYGKVDWIESKLYLPDEGEETLQKMTDYVMKRYKLHFGEAKNVTDFINRYGDEFFALLDKGYENLYGTVPFTENMKKQLIANFKLIVDLKHVAVILDENDKVVCLGICFPSIARAVQKSKGKLTPAALVRLLKAIKKPEIIDLGLIAVEPEYMNRGVSTIFSTEIIRMLKSENIEYAETNLNLEDNFAIQNQWKRFKQVKHKRRRAYVKTL